MIDYSKLKINQQVVSKILSIDYSCGVLTCYVLSLIFKFKFDIKEFKNIGLGLTDFDIHKYAERNGVNYVCKEKCGNKSKVAFADFDILCQNDIVMTLIGTNTNYGKPHNSILSFFMGNDFTQLFSHDTDCITKFSEVEGYYPTFYFKNTKIENFVRFY
jgi:hypothetical protein